MYLRIQIAVISALLLGLAGFNYIVDPYGVFLPESSFEFSRNKTEFFLKEPVIKPYRVSDIKPDTVILGLSAAALGYDENHPYFVDKSFYNFSMAGVSMYMVYRAFQHAMVESELRDVLLDLSMMSFNEYHTFVVRDDNNIISSSFDGLIAANEDGTRNWLAPIRKLRWAAQFLLSSHMARESLTTLEKQEGYHWNLNSRGGWRGATLAPGQSQSERILGVVRYIVNGLFLNRSSGHPFSVYREDGSLSRAFDYYERLLDDAYRNDIKVTLVISPTHTYFYEALDYLGFGEMFIDWKRSLVMINEKAASRNGRTPFPVWDFSSYSEISIEPVPAKEDTETRMKWFYDPLHFTRTTGNHVLDQIYLGRDGAGFLLTADNFDAILAIQQQMKEQFHRANPEQMKRMEAMYKRISKFSGAVESEQP